jgi:hypothetical protein
VNGLTTGKRYGCTVTAINAQGTSPASAPGRATVGAPGAPAILRVISTPNGVALAVKPTTDNGSKVISYRARCSSPTPGSTAAAPLQNVSPIIASNLTVGASYTCDVSAFNLRGEGPIRTSAAVIVGAAYHQASCHGSTGTVQLTHGLFLAASQTQTIDLAATLGTCTGGYVSAGRVKASFRSTRPMTCQNAIGVSNGGSGTLTWTSPAGMGTAGATVRFVFASTSGHSTSVHFYGDVTSHPNLFTGRHISGTITLNRGLKSAASGGDCRAAAALAKFNVTAINFSMS